MIAAIVTSEPVPAVVGIANRGIGFWRILKTNVLCDLYHIKPCQCDFGRATITSVNS